MQNNTKTCFLSACMLVCGAALAESTAENLGRIEAETMVLKAHEKQLEVRAQIAAKQNEIASKQADTERLTRSASNGDPLVRAVEGIGQSVYATLQLDNGNTIDVKAGDVLPNGMRMVSIRPNEVIVETRNKKRVRLNVVALAQAAYAPGYQGAGMPPPTPLPSMRGAGR